MVKDPRKESCQARIESGHIKTFGEIFQFAPVYLMANETENRYNPMVEMMEVIGVEQRFMVCLVLEQVEKGKARQGTKDYEESRWCQNVTFGSDGLIFEINRYQLTAY